MKPIRQVVVLAGGKGTRLGKLVFSTPKPMLPVCGDLSTLDLLIENAARHGYAEIVLVGGYLGGQLVERYSGCIVRGAKLSVLVEPEPRGTAGAVAFVADQLDDEFLLMNGDSLFDVNLRSLEMLLTDDVLAALALRSVNDAARYGTVTLENGRITQFREKMGCVEPALISGGIYAVRRTVVDLVQSLPSSLEVDIFPKLAAAGKLAGIACDGYFIDVGTPDTFLRAQSELPQWRTRPIAFLDRDGVLNVDDGWPHDTEKLVWIDGAREAVRLLNERGFLVVVVSNQAGVARGLYDEAQVKRFNAAVACGLALAGAHVDAFYYCPFHPQAVVEAYRQDSPNRKPKPGMLLTAFAEWPSKIEGSFLIGDAESDIAAAKAAGIPGYLFKSGSLVELVSGLAEVKQRQHVVDNC